MKAMDLQLEDGQDNPSCAVTSGICDPNVSLRTGKNRQKVTPSLCPAPPAAQQEKQGGQGPFSSQASGGPRDTSGDPGPDPKWQGEGSAPHAWLRPPTVPSRAPGHVPPLVQFCESVPSPKNAVLSPLYRAAQRMQYPWRTGVSPFHWL